MDKIREIIRLASECGLSQRQIARAVGVSRPVVAQYLIYFRSSGKTYREIALRPDEELREMLVGKKRGTQGARYEAMTALFPTLGVRLKEKGQTIQNLWKEYLAEHPDGYSYSQFCYHYQVWREVEAVTMHIEYKAGDKMLVDFTGEKLEVIDPDTGKPGGVEVFVAVLGASQLTYVEAVATQQKEDWIRGNVHALRYFGGVPGAIVPDCLKSAITTPDKYEPDVNPEYADFARHYETVILPARSRRARDKALVENAVKISYTRIFVPLRHQVFHSLRELNEAMFALLEEHNRMKFQRLGISRRELFEQVERATLRPLPPEEYELKKFCTLKVQFNYHVYLSEDAHYYSVPYRYLRKDVRVIYTACRVELFYRNVRIAFHRRDRRRGGYTTLAEHMPPNHRYYANQSPERIREWAERSGEATRSFIEALLKRRKHPEQAYRSCLGVLSLGRKYGNDRLNLACVRAVAFGAYSYRAVKNILAQGLERIEEEACIPAGLPEHENVRGTEYYA